MRTIHLHGALGKRFGAKHRFDVATAAEALRALNCAFPSEFVSVLREGSYQIIRGRRHGGFDMDIDAVTKLNLGNADLHVVPIAAGAKSRGASGALKGIAGALLIGAAIFMSGGTLAAPLAAMGTSTGVLGITWGNVAIVGLGMMIAGISTALAKPETPANEADDQSFSFGGPLNTNEQGNAIPLIYGQVIVGGQPISAGMDIEDISKYKNNAFMNRMQNAVFGPNGWEPIGGNP